MKLRRIISFLVVLGTCFASRAQQYYNINGEAVGYDEEQVLLINEQKQTLDSARVQNGRFHMQGVLQSITPVTIKIANGREMFLLTENPVHITVHTDTARANGKQYAFARIAVSGDADQVIFKRKTHATQLELFAMMAIAFVGEEADSLKKDSLIQMYAQQKTIHKALKDSIVQHCPDSYVSAMILLSDYSRTHSGAALAELFEQLTPRVRKSSIGISLSEKIAQLKTLGVGAKAPNFQCTSPDGKTFSLDSLRGTYKCLLIDFWASWCAPCIREVPNILSVYTDYHNRGFQVLSVSIDDDGAKWRDAILKHQMPWLHTSDLGGWKSDVAQLYNISAVPAMFLLNEEGIIISTKARGDALRQLVDTEILRSTKN